MGEGTVDMHEVVLQAVHTEVPGSVAAETEGVVVLDVRNHKEEAEEEDPWVGHHTAERAGLVDLVLNHQLDLSQCLTLALEQLHPSVGDPWMDKTDALSEVGGEVG